MNDFQAAKKSLGQNFLTDRNIARKIVDTLRIDPADRVLEIGPGPGALTVHLQEARPAFLLLAEKDHHWAAVRQRALAQTAQPGQTLLIDALTLPWKRFSGPWKVVGNLPYNVASPLMWDIVSSLPGLTRAVFMIQKEVGQRIVAAPGSKAYGALTAWIQAFCRPRMEFVVPPQVFTPRPKVDSAVLSFEPLPADERPDAQTAARLSDLLHLVFQQRRKQMGGILRKVIPDPQAFLAVVDEPPTVRPEQIGPESFVRLAREFRQ